MTEAGRYLVMRGRADAGGVGAGGESESVTHAFQPVGKLFLQNELICVSDFGAARCISWAPNIHDQSG